MTATAKITQAWPPTCAAMVPARRQSPDSAPRRPQGFQGRQSRLRPVAIPTRPYVAIFDADFVPPPDFLRRTVPALVADSGLAFVQARWGHANRNANWLTRVQGLLLDAHFAVEQEARFRAGLPHVLQRQRRRVEPHRDRTGRRLDRRHPDRRSRSFHALHDAGLARRHGARPGGAGRIAADRRGVARAAGALDQGPCPMRPQAAAA